MSLGCCYTYPTMNTIERKSPARKVYDLITAIEARIPVRASESWDNVGLLAGDSRQSLRGVVIGVDLTEALLAEAIRKKANLIILHHPPMFPKGRGVSRLILGRSNELPTLLLQAFQKNICVYVAHTNFDRCALDGMMKLALDLGGTAYARVWEEPNEGETLLKKLVTYVPVDHFEAVRDALYMAGCGHIGNYDCCGFSTAGFGNYRPLQGASPFLGKVGEMEEVEEVRLETLIVAGMEQVAIETLLEAHPYEEVAYDLYPVEQDPVKKGLVWGMGYGFVAELEKPVGFDEFVKRVKRVFKVDAFLANAVTPKKISRIAFTPGKGASFVASVRSHRPDIYITGEVGYHGSLDALRAGMGVFELGHRESEHYFLKTFLAWCKEWKVRASALDERTQAIL
jgi:dinuclear metal center YbgI/SA1388 family protein